MSMRREAQQLGKINKTLFKKGRGYRAGCREPDDQLGIEPPSWGSSLVSRLKEADEELLRRTRESGNEPKEEE